MKKLHLLIIVFAISHGLLSCAPFAPAARLGHEAISMPESFSIGDSLKNPDQRWWEVFDDRQLNSFIEQSFAANQALDAYRARLDKARAQARKVGADFSSGAGGRSPPMGTPFM